MTRSREQFKEMRDQSRREIVEASLTLFSKAGFAATTVDAIAAEAGISKGLIYRHYASKDAILEDIFIARLDALKGLVQAIRQEPDPRIQFKNLIEDSIEDAIQDLRFYRIYYSTLLQPEVTPIAAKLLKELKKRMVPIDTLIMEILSELGFPDPELELRYCRSIIDGFIAFFAQDGNPKQLRQLGRLFLSRYQDLMTKGHLYGV